MSIGFTIPFAKSTGSLGYFEATNDEITAVQQNIKSLVLTNWGERVMHYDFGCNLIEFLFEQEGESSIKERIADRIISQTNKWMPYVTIDNLNILFSYDDDAIPEHCMKIVMTYHIASRPDLSAMFDIVVIQ